MLHCRDGSLYTGIATDVDRRIREHEGVEDSGKGAKYLRGRGPLRLVWQLSVGNRSVASKLEYKIKSLSRIEKEQLLKGKMNINTLLEQTCTNE